MSSKYFDTVADKVSPESKRFTQLSFDLVDRIHALLVRRNMSQRDLAEKMKKRESEISKWLAPGHNFTLKSLAKLEMALEAPLLVVPGEEEDASEQTPSATSPEQELPAERKPEPSQV